MFNRVVGAAGHTQARCLSATECSSRYGCNRHNVVERCHGAQWGAFRFEEVFTDFGLAFALVIAAVIFLLMRAARADI